jgi:hypothetical protein
MDRPQGARNKIGVGCASWISHRRAGLDPHIEMAISFLTPNDCSSIILLIRTLVLNPIISGTKMNRYEIALQVLEKLTPKISGDPEWHEEVSPRVAPGRYPLGDEYRQFEEYVHAIMPLPEQTILFGRCQDGLPLLMDLKDPSSGAILIQSSSKQKARLLLKSILTSAHLINPSHQVKYTLITPRPAAFEGVLFQDHCHKNFHPNDREAGQHVLEISALVEQRYSGRRRGPALLMAIDDLEAFERGSLDEEAFSHLQWIWREGPGVGVWSVVAAEINGPRAYQDHLISQFGSVVFDSKGWPSPQALDLGMGNLPGYEPSFGVSIAGEILEFCLPFS